MNPINDDLERGEDDNKSDRNLMNGKRKDGIRELVDKTKCPFGHEIGKDYCNFIECNDSRCNPDDSAACRLLSSERFDLHELILEGMMELRSIHSFSIKEIKAYLEFHLSDDSMEFNEALLRAIDYLADKNIGIAAVTDKAKPNDGGY